MVNISQVHKDAFCMNNEKDIVSGFIEELHLLLMGQHEINKN